MDNEQLMGKCADYLEEMFREATKLGIVALETGPESDDLLDLMRNGPSGVVQVDWALDIVLKTEAVLYMAHR